MNKILLSFNVLVFTFIACDSATTIPTTTASIELDDDEVDLSPNMSRCGNNCIDVFRNFGDEHAINQNQIIAASGELMKLKIQDEFENEVFSAFEKANLDIFEIDQDLFFRIPYVATDSTIEVISDSIDLNILISIKPIQISHLSGDIMEPADENSLGRPLGREYAHFWFSPFHDDDLYLLGGFDYVHRKPQQNAWRYNLHTNEWSPVEVTGDLVPSSNTSVVQLPNQETFLPIGFTFYEDGSQSIGHGIANIISYVERDKIHSRRALDTVGARYQGAVWYDSDTKEVYSLCGAYVSPLLGLSQDCHETSFNTLDKLTNSEQTTGLSNGRTGFAWGHHQYEHSIIIFSGEENHLDSGIWEPNLPEQHIVKYNILSHEFEDIDIGGHFSGRRNPGYFYDNLNQRLFIFGGTADGQTTVQDFIVIHNDPGNEQIYNLTNMYSLPPFRSSSVAAYSSSRDVAILGFGNTAQAVYTDLWSFDLSPE